MQVQGQDLANEADATIRSALAGADPGLLVATVAVLTGDQRWREEPYLSMCKSLRQAQYAGEPFQLDARLQERAIEAAFDVLRDVRDGSPPTRSTCTDAELITLMQLVTGDDPGKHYLTKLRQDLRLDTPSTPRLGDRGWPEHEIVVIGAGMSGLNMAMRLKDAGFTFTVLDKNPDLGGTWFENTYPECGVDTRPHLYDWSLAPNPNWSRYDAKKEEILAYIQSTSAARGLREHVRFDTKARSLSFDVANRKWDITVESGDGTVSKLRADVVITAVGTLNMPKIPQIDDLDSFAGPAFHTAAWRHDVDLNGKRIGIIGNGSSGVQVGRSLARVGSLVSFQRSPAWVAPRRSEDFSPVSHSTQWLLAHLPVYAGWHRFLLEWEHGDRIFPTLMCDPEWHGEGVSAANDQLRKELTDYLHSQVGDRPDLVDKLLPDYPPYAKRLVVDNDWLATMAKPNVELVTEDIVRATPTGLVTADGRHHDLDVLVFATGFQNNRFLFPMQVRGRTGQTIEEVFGADDDARAYLGISMPGFPNLFSLQGPNSAAGFGGSATYVNECQAHYILHCLVRMAQENIATIEVDPDVCEAYNKDVDAGLARTVWAYEGVDSRYKNHRGRVFSNHAWTLQQFWEMTRVPDFNAYRCERTGNSTQTGEAAASSSSRSTVSSPAYPETRENA